jgi:choice-of-anchor A domain-containing protein
MDLKFYATPATAQLFSLKKIFLFVLSAVMYTGIAIAQPNNGIILNGTSNRVSVPTAPSLNISSAITIETWVKYTRAVGVQNVVAKSNNLVHNSYIFPRTENGWETVQFMVNLNALGWQVLEVPFSGSNHAFFDQWHHLAATFDGLVMSIYVDGVLAGSRSAVGSITVNNNPLWIGGQSGTSEYFRGKLDDVRLWRRALSQCEIASNKNCGLTGNETGLAAYYKFDQGVADGINPLQLVVDDATPNNNDGQTNLSLTGLLTSNWTTGIVSGICPPLAPIEATVGSVESSVIAGSDIHLLAGGGDTYSWVGPNGFTSTQQNPVITNASSLNSGTYTVTITKNGCSVVLSTLVLVTDLAKALFLDGQNDWVSVPNSNSLNFSNHLTIETWIYPTSHSPLVQNVVSKATEPGNSGYIFPRTDDGWQTVSFWLKINNQWQKVIVPFTGFSQWTHVAATYDGLFMKIFINGVEVGSLSAPGAISANTNNLSIGQQPGGLLSEYYKGGVDELRLWNRALSHCEIQNNMNCQLNGANNGLANQVDLVAYYRFNQGLVAANNAGITTLIDSSGHNNNGTLLNFALTGTTSNWAAGSAINNASCTPYTATLPSITGSGPVVEVGQTIELTASDGTAWSWTGPLGFTSNQQTIIIPNSTPDRSGVYTVNITGNGCTAPVSTKIKVAYKAGTLHFDGVNDQVVVPNSASVNISKTITLESWIKPTNSSRLIQSVLSKSTKKVNTGYIFPRTDDGWQNLTFYLHVNNAWEQMIVPYPALNEWHHVAATYDGYYMRIYIDGLLQGAKLIAAGGDITVNANDLMIGQQGGFTDPGIEEYFQGDLEELRIWNRALSQCEIINNMNCEVGQLQNNGLAAYYKFNQGYVDADNTAITTLIDATPNANHGTLQQFTLDGLTSNWSTLKTTGTCVNYAQPDVAASANGTVFAPGSIIRLFGTGGVTYTWDGPNNFASTDNSPVINNVQFPNTGVYTVTAPFVNCVITASVRLVVSNLTPLITSGPTTFCPSGSVTISTDNKGSAFQWLRDNVAIPNATDSFYVATESGSYSVSVTTATDVLVSEPVSVTVIDNEAPVVASLPTLHLETPATVAVAPTAFDNCAGTVTGTTQDPVHFEVPGTYNITWTFDDGNGNTSTETQIVEVVWSPDVVAPELTIPANITRANDNGICGAVVNFTATATDNRPGTVVITYSQDPGTIFAVGTTTVTVTATDEAGNIATGNFTVTVNDVEVPVLTLPANVNSNSATGITVGTATATDNCGAPVVSHSTIPASFPLGTTNITWTATDAAGNTVSGVQTVTVTDVTAPTLYGVPANTAVVCGNLPSVPMVTATDDFDANPAVVMTVTNNGNIVTRTWTATDASGNSTSASQVITLMPDTEAPVMTAPANVTSTSGTGINIGTATATDNCSTPTVSHSTLPASFPLGVTNVIWTATDAAGNTTTGIQTVTVSDVTAPVLVGVPANTTAPCGVVPAAANVTATDNFDASPVVTMTETTNGNIITRTWTATDAGGNTSSATQTITVIPDTEAPVMAAPANVTSTSGTGINIGTATATDNCSTPTVSHSTLPASFPLGVTNVIWTATDAAGNITTGIQTVTVSDVTAPVLVGVPANTTAPCGVVPAAANVTATDNFDANPVVTMTETTNGNTITRTWTATDASGNSSSATQVITIISTAAPIITGPTSGTVVTQNPVSGALEFNVFAQNGVTFGNAQSHGPVALGGDLTLSGGYSVSNNSAGTFKVSNVPVTLLMGGKVNYSGGNGINVNQNGYVKIGNGTGSYVWYKDQNNAYSPIRITPGSNYNGSPRINLQANSQQLGVSATNNPVFEAGLIDFATAFNQLKTNAASLGAMTDNANLTNANGGTIPHTNLPTQVKINLATGVNVLNINAGDLNYVQNFTYNNQPDASHILVINVNAPGSFNWNVWNSGGIGDQNGKYIIYNFYNTTALTVQGNGSVMGTLFAPYATINKASSQNISGQIIGQSFVHTSGTNTYYKFEGTITSGSTTVIAQNSNNTRATNNANCSYTVNSSEFNITAAPGDNCGSGVVTLGYTLTGATTGTGTNLAGVVLNPGTTTVTWTATSGSSVSTYVFNVTVQANIPAAPSVTAVNNCGSTTLNATGSNLLWSNNATGSSIIVNNPGDYTVTQTVNGCTSAPASVTAAPNAIPAAPAVNAVNNCGSTTLNATGSNLLWSNNATGSSIIVNTPGDYTVTQTVNGCTSVPAFVTAAPNAIPAAPAVNAVNNCGSTTLNATGSNLLWSNNATGSSIIVTSNGTYSVTATVNGCTSAATEIPVTISAFPSVAQIGGNTTVTAGSTTQLTNSTGSGTWSSYNNSIVTVDANGLVSGVNAGSAVISYTVTSTAGCTTVVTATVTVNPNCVAPVVTAANVVANTTSTSTNCTSPVTYTVNVTATPAATVTYTLSGATTGTGNGTGSGVVFNTGVTTVVVSATNSCGSTSATFTITLRDGTAPVPNVTTLAAITGKCSVSLAATTSNNNNVCQDDCRCCRNSCHCRGNNGCRCRDWDYRYRGIVSLILYYLGGYGNWDDDDNHGCGDDNSGPQTSNAPKATDNCKGVIVGTTTDPLTYTAQGTYTINWKFDDGNGNITIQQQTVIVRDDVKPVIDCPNNISVSCGSNTTPSGCNSTATATDNCGTPVITYSDVTSGNVITRTWKATDAAGNFSTCEQTITVVDNTRPTISDISDRTVSCNASTAPSATGTPTASDNCGTPVVTYSDVTSGNVITRTWRATDAFGNYSTSTQKITTVADNTKPVISDVADKTVSCNASTAPSATGTATATDNCSTPVVTYSDVTSGNVITRTWKATDAAGNYNTSTQTITIGSAFTASVVSKPTNSTYTGGNENNLYLGYGAQSTKLEVCTLPSSGAPYTYAWSGSSTNRLNSTSSSAPTFTPVAAGTYTYVVTVTNKFGCTSTDNITICVTDIRVPGTNGSKVYVCHKTGSKKNPNYQTLQISVNAVSAHLNHGCGNNDDDDRLGSCNQTPCNTSTVNAVAVSTQQGITAEGGSAVTTNSVVAGKTAVTTEEELKVIVMPNPSTTYFTLKFESRIDAPLDLRVMDGNGRVVDAKSRIGANSTLQIGHNYTSGTYYAEISQNGKRKVIQLIKVRG